MAVEVKKLKNLLSVISQFGLSPSVAVTVQAERPSLLSVQHVDGPTAFRVQTEATVEKPGAVAVTYENLAKLGGKGRADHQVQITTHQNQLRFDYGRFRADVLLLPADQVVSKVPEVKPNLTLRAADIQALTDYLDFTLVGAQIAATLVVKLEPLKKGYCFVTNDPFTGAVYFPKDVEGVLKVKPALIPRPLLRVARWLGEDVGFRLSERLVAVVSGPNFYQSRAGELSQAKDVLGRLREVKKRMKLSRRFVVEAAHLREALEDVTRVVDKATTVTIHTKGEQLKLKAVGASSSAEATVDLVEPVKGKHQFDLAVAVLKPVLRLWNSPLTVSVYEDKLVIIKGEEPYHVEYLLPAAY